MGNSDMQSSWAEVVGYHLQAAGWGRQSRGTGPLTCEICTNSGQGQSGRTAGVRELVGVGKKKSTPLMSEVKCGQKQWL